MKVMIVAHLTWQAWFVNIVALGEEGEEEVISLLLYDMAKELTSLTRTSDMASG